LIACRDKFRVLKEYVYSQSPSFGYSHLKENFIFVNHPSIFTISETSMPKHLSQIWSCYTVIFWLAIIRTSDFEWNCSERHF